MFLLIFFIVVVVLELLCIALLVYVYSWLRKWGACIENRPQQYPHN